MRDYDQAARQNFMVFFARPYCILRKKNQYMRPLHQRVAQGSEWRVQPACLAKRTMRVWWRSAASARLGMLKQPERVPAGAKVAYF